jgi:hypothetical protein
MGLLTLDTKEEIDEDEPLVDVCYISDILVNMITGDSQQIGINVSLPSLIDRRVHTVEF